MTEKPPPPFKEEYDTTWYDVVRWDPETETRHRYGYEMPWDAAVKTIARKRDLYPEMTFRLVCQSSFTTVNEAAE